MPGCLGCLGQFPPPVPQNPVPTSPDGPSLMTRHQANRRALSGSALGLQWASPPLDVSPGLLPRFLRSRVGRATSQRPPSSGLLPRRISSTKGMLPSNSSIEKNQNSLTAATDAAQPSKTTCDAHLPPIGHGATTLHKQVCLDLAAQKRGVTSLEIQPGLASSTSKYLFVFVTLWACVWAASRSPHHRRPLTLPLPASPLEHH